MDDPAFSNPNQGFLVQYRWVSRWIPDFPPRNRQELESSPKSRPETRRDGQSRSLSTSMQCIDNVLAIHCQLQTVFYSQSRFLADSVRSCNALRMYYEFL